MKERLQQILGSAKSTTELAQKLAAEKMNSVESAWRGLGLRKSLSALSVAELERDETHYLLIPFPSRDEQSCEFILFSKRVIPAGYGANNSLPKERIFHLSDLSVEESLRSQLKESLAAGELGNVGGGILDFADRLERLAEEVDKETEKVSGGILIVGGLTTLINPIVGIGMMASGVLPKIGGKLARSGAALAGDQLRDWSEKREQKRLEKKTSEEVERVKPQIYINPILRRLEALITHPKAAGDPLLEGYEPVGDFPELRYLQVTTEGLAEVYHDTLKAKMSPLTPSTLAWVRSLAEMQEQL